MVGQGTFFWVGDEGGWTEGECTLYEVYVHEAIEQDWSSEVVFLLLEDWELARVALSCHMALDLLCQEMREACQESSMV